MADARFDPGSYGKQRQPSSVPAPRIQSVAPSSSHFDDGSFGRQPDRKASATQIVAALPSETSNPPKICQSAVVVYVHGIGAQTRATLLKQQYDTALFRQDMGDKSRLAYWSDILHPPTSGANVSNTRGLLDSETIDRSKLDQILPDESQWPDQIHEQLSVSSGSQVNIRDAAIEWGLNLASKMLVATPSSPSAAKTMGLSAKVLPPGPVRGWLLRQLTWTLLNDVYQYLFDAGIRTQIQDRVLHLLPHDGGPYYIVSHSLGTVIAYDVLQQLCREPGSQLSVPLWITLGSPLGIAEIQDKLERDADGELSSPIAVTDWRNFADEIDPIALDKSLKDDFKASPPQTIEDDPGFVNLDSRSAQGFNPHSALGYIGHPDVQKAVQDRLVSNFAAPTANFVIARDIANEMCGHTNRMPVLIELEQLTDADQAARSLVERSNNLVDYLRQLTQNDVEAKIEPLKRYIAAKLTPEEIAQLHVRVTQPNNRTGLSVSRVWKNSTKKTLIYQSAQRVQVYTARLGYGATGENIGWAVIDTGICDSHPHFSSGGFQTIAAQWDCTLGVPLDKGNLKTTTAVDMNGHGTHVAGIIAGRGRATIEGKDQDLVGMAEKAQLHIYKALDEGGQGDDSYIIKALDHIAQVNQDAGRLVIHGVNLSLGGPFDAKVYGCGQSPLCRELRRLWQLGVLVCVAAGNEGTLKINTATGDLVDLNLDLSIGDPANLEEAIAVGSVNRDFPHLNGVSYFSSRGPTADGRSKPDVVAPGEWIWSCNFRHTIGDLYIPDSGTSMSCPHVSGLLAAFLSVRKEFAGRPDEVKRLLLKYAIDLGRDRYHQGAGLPNLIQMLTGT